MSTKASVSGVVTFLDQQTSKKGKKYWRFGVSGREGVFGCLAFDEIGESIAVTLKKGDKVLVTGELKNEKIFVSSISFNDEKSPQGEALIVTKVVNRAEPQEQTHMDTLITVLGAPYVNKRLREFMNGKSLTDKFDSHGYKKLIEELIDEVNKLPF